MHIIHSAVDKAMGFRPQTATDDEKETKIMDIYKDLLINWGWRREMANATIQEQGVGLGISGKDVGDGAYVDGDFDDVDRGETRAEVY